MEAVTGQHFFFHDQPEHAAEKDSCHFCQLRAFPIHQTTPVTIVNAKDQAVIPPNFRFIDRMVLGQGVEPAEDSFRSGCSCESDSECQYMGCLCLADLGDEEGSSSDEDEDIHIHANGANGDGPEAGRKDKLKQKRKAYAYHTHGAKAGLLRSKMLNSKEPLYECHAGCSCSKDCPNRVVERGRTIPLQIFRTDDRGWGVRTQVAIKKGQFVDRYLGEIITSAEADRRRAASAVSKRKDVYLFALDKFTHPESLDPRLKGPPLEVDGEFLSGPTRFINHSCEPNLRIFARVGDHADKHIHDLALFAIRDVARGEELTFDYVDGMTEDGGPMEGAGAGDMAKWHGQAPYEAGQAQQKNPSVSSDVQINRRLADSRYGIHAMDFKVRREFLFGGISTPLASLNTTQRNSSPYDFSSSHLFTTFKAEQRAASYLDL